MGLSAWWSRKKELINTGLTLNRAADQWEKDMKTEANPSTSIVKGLKAIAGLALFAGLGGIALFLMEPGVIEAALAAAGVNAAYAAAIVLVLRGAATAYLNWRKHNPPTPSNTNAGPLVLLLLLPAFATAQEPAPTPEPDSIRFSTGGTRFYTPGQGDATEMEGQVLGIVHVPGKLVAEGFGRYTRTQGTEASAAGLDAKSFRSIVADLKLRRQVLRGWVRTWALCMAGVSWSRDKAFDPSDPNVWAIGCGVTLESVKGSFTSAIGHNGSVGGKAVFGQLTINRGERVRYVATYAIPFSAERFRTYPGAFTSGVQVDAWVKERQR